VLALVAAAALALGGCGGGTAPSVDGAGDSPLPVGTVVQVTEHEFQIILSQETFTAGDYAFELGNDGTVVHNLTIAGPGLDGAQSPDVLPGETGLLNVTLEKGTYELWCTIGNHKASGMDITITVS